MSQSTAYFRPATHAQGLANYPHARTITSSDGKGTTSTSQAPLPAAATGLLSELRPQKTTQSPSTSDNRLLRCCPTSTSEGKASIRDVVDATVFLTNMKDDYQGMNSRLAGSKYGAGEDDSGGAGFAARGDLVEIKCTVYYT